MGVNEPFFKFLIEILIKVKRYFPENVKFLKITRARNGVNSVRNNLVSILA